MFIKLSSYSNLTTHVFYFTACSPFHYAVHKIDQARVAFYPLGKMENFIQSDCFCRYTTVTVVPSLSIDDNLVIEISGVCVQKKTTLRSRITEEF